MFSLRSGHISFFYFFDISRGNWAYFRKFLLRARVSREPDQHFIASMILIKHNLRLFDTNQSFHVTNPLLARRRRRKLSVFNIKIKKKGVWRAISGVWCPQSLRTGDISLNIWRNVRLSQRAGTDAGFSVVQDGLLDGVLVDEIGHQHDGAATSLKLL